MEQVEKSFVYGDEDPVGFKRPSQPLQNLDGVDTNFVLCNELMALYVLQTIRRVSRKGLSSIFDDWCASYCSNYGRLFPDYTAISASSIASELIRMDPSSRAVLRLFDSVTQWIEEGCQGSIEANLFRADRMSLWQDYFHPSNRLYQVNNTWLAQTVGSILPSGGAIMELGGGFGSAASTLIGALNEHQKSHSSLIFTELVPFFLNRARRNLRHLGMPIVFEPYDINTDGRYQDETLDVIYGVNVLHVAYDLQATLRRLHALLKPEGHLVIMEAVRPAIDVPIFPEYVFGFFKDFNRCVYTSARPKPGFLDRDHWLQNLKDAGYSHVSLKGSNMDPDLIYPFNFAACFVAQK